MEATERKLVLEHLAASRKRLLQAVDGLSAEQRTFQPAEDRWSVAGCVEHIIVVEDFVFQTMNRVLQAPPEPAKQADVRRKDPIVIERVPARTSRVMGPEMVHPKNRWPDFEELLRQPRFGRSYRCSSEHSLRAIWRPWADV